MPTADRTQDAHSALARLAQSKVPEVTVLFWIIKVLTTGMGEAASDWLLNRGAGVAGIGITVSLGLDVAIFVVALILQFSTRRYVAGVYWFAVVAVSLFGTIAADIAFIIGVPLWASTTFYAGALTVNFAIWYVSEKTLSIHSIHTRRRETFYWITVFLTFALGTALGDLTAVTWKLGFLVSGIMFAALIAVPAIAHWRFGLNAIVAFWFAYVVTRPLGASFADWFGASHHDGGLGLGFGWVTLVMTIMIIGLVGYLARSQRGSSPEQLPAR
ncbi:MAG TPA: hypothetical protein VGD73_26520 [Pseudonocardia sp.]|uniref:COG4705 family protein n=1 Tax=Pseudonocardia sp. TaxID=60912 RepID=UPI002ED99032